MRILHTSDWHLGRSLFGRKRYAEFEKFLNWLLEIIDKRDIDILLISGDVFDTTTPGNRAQELYYRFLFKTGQTSCRHIVIIGGNHDSPSFLNAPKELLKAMQIHVIAAAGQNPEDEVITLLDPKGNPEAVVCAVPYLRDRDVREVEAGESLEDKGKKMVRGIAQHYRAIEEVAENTRKTLTNSAADRDKKSENSKVPLLVMGHLFTSGGKTAEGDGVRDLYVGNIAHISKSSLPANASYTALGHLHIPQKVDGDETVRYSGSPIPMGFGEAAQRKQVIEIEIKEDSVATREIYVPIFQELMHIQGTMEEIRFQVDELKSKESDAWLEIIYTGTSPEVSLRSAIEDLTAESNLEVVIIKNRQIVQRSMESEYMHESLDDLEIKDVFIRCLNAFEIEDGDRAELIQAHDEIVTGLFETDSNAE